MKRTKLTSFVSLKSLELPAAYEAEFTQEAIEQLKAATIAAVRLYVSPLFLLFLVADFTFYPSYFYRLAFIRAATVAGNIGLTFLFRKLKTLTEVELLSSINVQVCSISILAMLYMINDPHTNYYSGLFLVITGAAITFRYRIITSALNLFSVLVGYSFVELSLLHHGKTAIFNILIVAGVVLISFVTRLLMNNVQISEFIARQNLSEEIKARNRIIEIKTAENVRYKSLEQQFSPQVIRQINEGGLSLNELRDSDVAVVFYDIVNSTKKSNEIDSTAYQKVLNPFLEQTIAIMLSYDLTIGSFLGDGILGFTNQPFQQDNFVDRILLASMDVVSNVKEHQAEFAQFWGEEFSITTGISVGRAKVGFFGGSAAFKHYTAIGPVVNKAKRIGACCKKNQILIDDSVKEAGKAEYGIESVGAFELKGFHGPQPLYQVKSKPNTIVVGQDGEEFEVVLNEKGIYEFKKRPNTKKKAA